MAPRDQRFDDLRALGVNAYDRRELRLVLANVVFDGDEADIGGVRSLAREKAVRSGRTVVQHQDGRTVVSFETGKNLAWVGQGFCSEIGVHGKASIKRLGSDRVLE